MWEPNTHHSAVLGPFGPGCQPGRQFSIGVFTLGESPLKSCPKGRWPHGQMFCPVRQGAKGAVPSPAKARPALPSRGIVVREEVTAQAEISPSSHIRASWTLGKQSDFFQPYKRVHFTVLAGWTFVPSLYPSCQPEGTGHEVEGCTWDHKAFFCTCFTKDKFTRLCRMIVLFVDGTGN